MKIPGTQKHVYGPWQEQVRAERRRQEAASAPDGPGTGRAPAVPPGGAMPPRRPFLGFIVGAKLPPANASATSAATTAAPSVETPRGTPVFVNPLLTVRKSGRSKQYLLGGVPVFSAYRQRAKYRSRNKSAQRPIGQGGVNTVRSRSNPNASVYVKRSQKPPSFIALAQRRCRVLNELAQRLAAPDAAAMRDHFAAEIMKEVDATGHAVYYTPIVKGFSMAQYLDDPAAFTRHVQAAKLRQEADRLKAAMQWLHALGFVHCDPSPGNIMYDLDRHKLVLIDFEFVLRSGDDLASSQLKRDLALVDAMKRNL
jgi:hypothetical protein